MKLKLVYVFFLAALIWQTASWTFSLVAMQQVGDGDPVPMREGTTALSQGADSTGSAGCHKLGAPCGQDTECGPTGCSYFFMPSQYRGSNSVLPTKYIHASHVLTSLDSGPASRPPRT